MTKGIIVDDEPHCIDTLSILLQNYCPEVEVVGSCTSGKEGIAAILELQPDLVFLDIEMPVMNGFEMLEQLKDLSFSVIFTTSFDQYALKAIRFSALDYLLKPVDPKELVQAVHKAQSKLNQQLPERFELLFSRLHQKVSSLNRIAIPTLNGYELLNCDRILYCQADDNYTIFFLKDQKKLTATLMLKEVEEQLQELSHFVRVHNSYIVNLNEVKRYVRGEGGYLVMSDDSSVSVSRSRKNTLLKWFHNET